MAQAAEATIGHNNPPDPIDEATSGYEDVIEEAGNWLDGEPVTSKEQMEEVDKLAAAIRECRSGVKKARDADVKPFHDAWKARVAKWKPTEDDLDRIQKGLAALVDGFKRKLAEEQAAREREERRKAEEARQRAEAARREADASNIEAQREAAALAREAEEARKKAAATSKEKVKGMRTVTRYEVTDHKALLHFIAKNHRDDVTAFIEDWARRNHASVTADGLRVWQERVAV